MTDPDSKLKILDCQASDHEYLHKDFHGALCYSIYYLDQKLGPQATRDYLVEVGRKNYKELVRRLRAEGLPALERHWQEVFTREGGKFRMEYEGQTLVLTVEECPAIAHLKKTGQLFTTRYCETTVVVNETICAEAGYSASCQYEPGEGRCVQKFWKETESK
ncbi:MAG TPA: hypothetical protein PLP42_14455 [Acidobacteriota bacterium]|nr:hypothetical protein [Acidobacteriota bacterium]